MAFLPVVAIDQIDIGAVVELLAAQLAHAQHGEASLPHAAPAVGRLGDPVPAHQAGPANLVHAVDDRLGQPGQLRGGVSHVDDSQNVAGADAQHLAALEAGQSPQSVFFGPTPVDGPAGSRAIGVQGFGPGRAQLVQQPVEGFRVANEDLGGVAGSAADQEHGLQGLGGVAQEAQEVHGVADHRQQSFEVVESCVGVGCFTDHPQQLSHHSRQGQPGGYVLRHQLEVAIGGCRVREAESGEEFRHLFGGQFRRQQQVFGLHGSTRFGPGEMIAILTCGS